jgi:hypothetical protein
LPRGFGGSARPRLGRTTDLETGLSLVVINTLLFVFAQTPPASSDRAGLAILTRPQVHASGATPGSLLDAEVLGVARQDVADAQRVLRTLEAVRSRSLEVCQLAELTDLGPTRCRHLLVALVAHGLAHPTGDPRSERFAAGR